MSARVSHSILDPTIGPALSSLYPKLRIPAWFPPEGIVAAGHLSAIVGALGLAFSTQYWWAGVVAALGIAGNHFADCIDGRHARATGQCRNGGELLDHFTDPLSFTYWMVGLAVACGRLDLGLVAVIVLMAMAVLTNIRAKLTGEFILASFGPTEFKTLLVGFALLLSLATSSWAGEHFATINAQWICLVGFAALCVTGVFMLPIQLYQAIRDVNENGEQPDTSEWITKRASK